jgi:hypothetical protein
MTRLASIHTLPTSGPIVALAALLLVAFAAACTGRDESPAKPAAAEERPQVGGRPLAMDDLVAWCIVPFDSRKRTPEERIAMLERLGFERYAYDWRAEHLPDTARELRLARDRGIRVEAVWMWIETDRPGKLSENRPRRRAAASPSTTTGTGSESPRTRSGF